MYGNKKGNEELCVASSMIAADYAKGFAHGHWSFLGPGSERKWYGTHTWPGGWGPEPACVQTPFSSGVAHVGGEGRINVLPWYRPVGVAKNLQLDARRGTGMTVLTSPGMRPGNRQGWWKTAAAHPGQARRFPGVVKNPRPQRVPARSRGGSRLTWPWLRGRYRLGHWPVVLLCW